MNVETLKKVPNLALFGEHPRYITQHYSACIHTVDKVVLQQDAHPFIQCSHMQWHGLARCVHECVYVDVDVWCCKLVYLCGCVHVHTVCMLQVCGWNGVTHIKADPGTSNNLTVYRWREYRWGWGWEWVWYASP